jgi:nitroreductase
MDALYNHRSIRKYQDKPIDDQLLSQILEAGVRASNTGNMQAYSIIVTRDPEIRKQLWEVHFKQNMVLQAPVHITFVADLNRFNKWCEMNDTEPGYDNFLWFYNATIDAVLASQNVCLAAEENGLGICYLALPIIMPISWLRF